MKKSTPFKKGFTLVELLVVIVIIAALAGLSAPQILRMRKKADATEATNNARQVLLGMVEFESDYGSLPNATTGATITAQTGSALTFTPATNSNGYFKQLIAAGIIKSEVPFYCKRASAVKPTGDLVTDATVLAAGEVGFSYVTGTAGVSLSGAVNPAIIVAPSAVAAGSGNFQIAPFDGTAVFGMLDGSVKTHKIGVATGPAAVGVGPVNFTVGTGASATTSNWNSVTAGSGTPMEGATAVVINNPLL